MENKMIVTEFPTFEAAWEAATATKSSFDYYQGMETKIGYIKAADRWFVTEDNKLWYSYVLPQEGLRIVCEASPISCLSNAAFQYIQIMVSPYDANFKEVNSNKGVLRFSGQYGDRSWACKASKGGDAFAFNK